jgi:hypothetical protein
MSINILLIIAHLLFHGIEVSEYATDFILDLTRRFSMDAEASIPTWFASTLLLSLGGVFFYVFTEAEKYQKKYWGVLAAVFYISASMKRQRFMSFSLSPCSNYLTSIQGRYSSLGLSHLQLSSSY